MGRGGGSLEDLWCFNDEQVARAITASKLPVVSAVGHETDFTIADFVADVRAPTPSAAAELLSADGRELLDKLSGFQTWLTENLRRRLMEQQQTLDWLSRQLKHPGKRLQEHSRRLEELEWRLRQSIQRTLQLQQNQLHSARIRLHNQSPGMQINTLAKDIAQLEARLKRGFSQHAGNRSTQLQHLAQRLNTVSPLATLSRGYSITKTRENTILRSSDQVQRGDTIRTQLHQGALICTVEQIEKPH